MTQTTNLTKLGSGNYPAAVKEYLWNWKETQIKVIYETRGTGKSCIATAGFQYGFDARRNASFSRIVSS
ncbi:hypothetical protein [Microcoleus vaginatus]|uniref:hypothetical protein n=1 Tax=Microcoleus vaginatus TaxID=119532 RepID=UPI00403FA3E2